VTPQHWHSTVSSSSGYDNITTCSVGIFSCLHLDAPFNDVQANEEITATSNAVTDESPSAVILQASHNYSVNHVSLQALSSQMTIQACIHEVLGSNLDRIIAYCTSPQEILGQYLSICHYSYYYKHCVCTTYRYVHSPHTTVCLVTTASFHLSVQTPFITPVHLIWHFTLQHVQLKQRHYIELVKNVTRLDHIKEILSSNSDTRPGYPQCLQANDMVLPPKLFTSLDAT
jgi:hypothetical protein